MVFGLSSGPLSLSSGGTGLDEAGRGLWLPNGAGLVVFQFLTELTRLFQKCRLSGSVFITLKKCKQLWTRQGRKRAGRRSETPGPGAQ